MIFHQFLRGNTEVKHILGSTLDFDPKYTKERKMIEQFEQDMILTPYQQVYKYFEPSQVPLLQLLIPNIIPKPQILNQALGTIHNPSDDVGPGITTLLPDKHHVPYFFDLRVFISQVYLDCDEDFKDNMDEEDLIDIS